MTDNAIRHYFQDFPTWRSIKGISAPGLDDVFDWASELVADNFISEEEAAELAAAAQDNPTLYEAPATEEGAKASPDESAAALGASPLPGLKRSIESFANKAGAAVKAFYDSNSVMVEGCEGDVLVLNNAISTMRTCAEKAAASLYSLGKAMSYQKNEDTLKAISLLGDAIKELAGDETSASGEEETGAPSDSLSSEVSAIYNNEPVPPESLPNPAEENPEA